MTDPAAISKGPPPYKVQVPWDKETEVPRIQAALANPVDVQDVSYRPSGHGSGTLAYLEGWRSVSLANEIFGFNGWSSEIIGINVDYVDQDAQQRTSIGMSCIVRVHLKDGTFHDDIGYGSADNQRSKGQAWEKAKKEAVTDALKRALRLFGNQLGNSLYDKEHLSDIRKVKANGVKNAPNAWPQAPQSHGQPQAQCHQVHQSHAAPSHQGHIPPQAQQSHPQHLHQQAAPSHPPQPTNLPPQQPNNFQPQNQQPQQQQQQPQHNPFQQQQNLLQNPFNNPFNAWK